MHASLQPGLTAWLDYAVPAERTVAHLLPESDHLGFSPHKVKTHIRWIMNGCWSALPRTTRGTVSSGRASFRMDRHYVPACWHAVAMALHRGR